MYELNVNIPGRSYPIYIENGLLDSLGEKIKKIYDNKKIAIITDTNVDRLYGHRIEKSLIKENFVVNKIIIEAGEKSKSFAVLEKVCDKLLEFGLSRGDLIITFGGGVVGDLGGFAASILLRGVPFVQVPTSLLAQIDSSIGGKVAINSNLGKNLIGSFHQPKAVFIDPVLLNTLNDRFLYDGMSEVIKYGAISDQGLLNELLKYSSKEELLNNIDKIIYVCCTIKKNVVEKDEKDTGDRMILNFGHTIGHGIERYFDYGTFTHGEAVAMGMYAITKNSELLGITEKGTTERLRQILEKYNLPYIPPAIDKAKIMETIKLDKKVSGSHMHIVLLKALGQGFVEKVNMGDIDKYLGL